MAFHPYLFFGGNCRQAFTRYKEVFGGELVLLTMKDMPSDEPAPAAQADLIMHAALSRDGNLLMGSDDPSDSFAPVQGMQVNYTVADVDEAKRVFEALADGGEVTMAISETFWSPGFGMCVDRFGIPWMVNAEAPAEPS
jgi:PhnB protein